MMVVVVVVVVIVMSIRYYIYIVGTDRNSRRVVSCQFSFPINQNRRSMLPSQPSHPVDAVPLAFAAGGVADILLGVFVNLGGSGGFAGGLLGAESRGGWSEVFEDECVGHCG